MFIDYVMHRGLFAAQGEGQNLVGDKESKWFESSRPSGAYMRQ